MMAEWRSLLQPSLVRRVDPVKRNITFRQCFGYLFDVTTDLMRGFVFQR
jgi:hypothetical protein